MLPAALRVALAGLAALALLIVTATIVATVVAWVRWRLAKCPECEQRALKRLSEGERRWSKAVGYWTLAKRANVAAGAAVTHQYWAAAWALMNMAQSAAAPPAREILRCAECRTFASMCPECRCFNSHSRGRDVKCRHCTTRYATHG
jgi:hypothetical protein